MTKNLLGGETSPYLLQHADNPVHWNPWGSAALARAAAEDKPILLSVGYAACHWCHVMAHESFENADIAAVMNEHYINIKVDREERPDLDAIYQRALGLLGQQGGWPLTMFLTPDGEPFWGGTYFPPDGRLGRPGFRDVLHGVIAHYRDQPDAVSSNVTALRDALAEMSRSVAGEAISIDVVDRAAQRLAQEFDMVNGGIGSAPKFPSPSILELLWRTWRRTGATALRDAVILTLDRMSQGGIYDHLGGGYARYSIDAVWLVPHFEKMLYDNAQLVDLLIWAWQETRSPLFEARIRETAEWVLREMVAAGGGFAASLDADSEGEEGRYYVWSEAEIDAVLGPDAALFKKTYDVTAAGNWEGKTILNRSGDETPAHAEQDAVLARCRSALLAEREKRVRPGWDDKVLADWNGLMIAALANAGAVFGSVRWAAAAAAAFAFVQESMTTGGRLRHSWRQGRLGSAATVDDYANMARAALVLHETTGEDRYLDAAATWVGVLDDHYWDADGGGYFFTADDAETLIVRAKSADDNATPSGNAVIASVLAHLFYLTGEARYLQRAEAVIAAFAGEVTRNFFPLAALLNSAENLGRAVQIVIVGARGEAETENMVGAVHHASIPGRVVAVIPPSSSLPPSHPAHGKEQKDGTVTAYVCVGQSCSLPLTSPEGLLESLKGLSQQKP